MDKTAGLIMCIRQWRHTLCLRSDEFLRKPTCHSPKAGSTTSADLYKGIVGNGSLLNGIAKGFINEKCAAKQTAIANGHKTPVTIRPFIPNARLTLNDF